MNKKTKGILFMVLSSMAFAMMQILIALTAKRIPVFEQMLFRNLITTCIACYAIHRKRLPLFGKKENRKMLLARSVFGFLGMFCLFYATSIGNQGEVAILSKLSPFVVIFCARFFLKEKPENYQIIALVIALAGAAVTANPKFSASAIPSLMAFLSSVFAGIAYFCVGALKDAEDPQVIVFVFSVFTTVLTAILTLFDFVIPSALDMLLLLGIGLMAAVGQIALTYSYSYAKASEVSVFNYTGIPFSMVFGFLILSQPIKATTLIGSVLVIVSGIVSFLGEKRRAKEI